VVVIGGESGSQPKAHAEWRLSFVRADGRRGPFEPGPHGTGAALIGNELYVARAVRIAAAAGAQFSGENSSVAGGNQITI